jgi:serine/threonine protein kinase
MMSERQAGETVGDFVLESVLGQGAMGIVFRGRPARGGSPVALKFLRGEALARADLRKRFDREARALAELRHPNVLEVIALGMDGEVPYMVTELLVGRTLESLLVETRLPPERALAIADQVLAGLGYAHAHGIIHRDVKPENVFLLEMPRGERAKLIDFGLVRFGTNASLGPSSVLTVSGTMMGSPAYMAPEQGYGEETTERSDVYSAGVLLYELLTGAWPFVAEEISDMIRAHALSPVPPLQESRPELEAKPALEAVVMKALAKRPKDRFNDAQEMQRALRAVKPPAAKLVM